MALAVQIASPQGVAFHTSTDAAPAERGARRPSLRRFFFRLFFLRIRVAANILAACK